MHIKNIGIIILILLLLIYIIPKVLYGHNITEFFADNIIDYYDYNVYNPIGSICIIGSVHGNEPIGFVALTNLINNRYFNDISKKHNINIRIIPCPNKYGIKNNTRYMPNVLYPDINRNFRAEKGVEPVSQTIIDLTKNYDLVIDLHEGWGFHRINKESVGSTLSPGRTNKSIKLAEIANINVNKLISEPLKKFLVLYERSCEIPNTLACHREMNKKHYILIETSGQGNLQPIEIRTQQMSNIIDSIINNYKN